MPPTNVKKKQPTELAPRFPCSDSAEKAVLGSIILDNDKLDECASLQPSEFFFEPNKITYAAILAMREAGKSIDLVTLIEKLENEKAIKVVGGPGYVSMLIDGLPDKANVSSYVLIIKQKAAMRGMIRFTQIAQEKAFATDSSEAFTFLNDCAQSLNDFVTGYATPKTMGKTSRQARLSLLESFEKQVNLLRINTGITELDKVIGGFRSRELITITASVTGSGKTLFAQQIKCVACKEGRHGLYFSGEMPAEQLASREIATETEIPHWKMRHPEQLSEDEYHALFANAANECETCRIIDGDLSIEEIRATCKKQSRAGKLSWVIIDYDELVEAPGKDEFAQQRYVIREAKRIATLCEVPVFVISQLKKTPDKNEAKKPTLDRIYGAGAKSKHSSFVLFVDREYVRELKGDETKARICVLKARDGKVGEIPLTFDTHKLRFREETPEEEFARAQAKKKNKKKVEEVEPE